MRNSYDWAFMIYDFLICESILTLLEENKKKKLSLTYNCKFIGIKNRISIIIWILYLYIFMWY